MELYIYPKTFRSDLTKFGRSHNYEDLLPTKYRDFVDVFDKVKANTFPKYKHYDFHINLQPMMTYCQGDAVK